MFWDLSNGFLGAQFGACLPFQSKLWTFATLAWVQFPKKECTWESLGSIPCIFPHFVRVSFTLKHIFLAHGPLHFTLSYEPNVRVATLSPTRKKVQCPHWHLEFSCFLQITILSPSLDLPWTLSFLCNCFPLFHGHQLLIFVTRLCLKLT